MYPVIEQQEEQDYRYRLIAVPQFRDMAAMPRPL